MSKIRVYELARELGVENKDLIARMERLNITVKSHSSSIEDSDVERIKRDFHAAEPHELVEKRVKSTIIRRRAVPSPTPAAEEAPAAPEAAAAPEAPPAEEKLAGAATPKPEPKPEGEPEQVKPAAQEAAPPARTPELHPLSRPAIIVSRPAPAPSAPPRTSDRPPTAPPSGERSYPPRRDAQRDVPPGRRPAAPGTAPTGATEHHKKVVVNRADLTPRPAAPAAAAKKPVTGKWVPQDKRRGGKKTFDGPGSDAAKKKSLLLKKLEDKRFRAEDFEWDERAGKWRERDEDRDAVKMKKTLVTVPKAIKRRVKVGEAITVSDLAKKMGIKAGEVINKLIKLGMMVTINQSVDYDTATLIAAEFNYQVEQAGFEYDESVSQMETEPRNLKPRAPVVTIMGHVDHGKTSLLDAIRSTNVIDGEAGGITQAIGAYHVHIKGRDIVFLDTPGHEAFTAMRARGAKVTDIVILVVAADDGVMEQTVEAINHSRAAEVPIMVAINKIDKPGADPQRIKQALTEYNLLSEDWGGETIFCEVSAKQKEGIEELLEMILLQADMLQLQADPDRPARGTVIEAKLDKGRGPVATVLIQEGTLREGDTFACKTEFGRVRAMINDQGRRVKEAGPSVPVEVIGFSKVPAASAEFLGVEDEKKAKSMADYWIRKERDRELSATSKITLEQLYEKIKEGVKELNVIIKGDVQGSIEALAESLSKLSTADVKLKIIHSSTGAITETDVMLASSANAVLLGFNVRPDSRVSEIAEAEGVEIKLYDIIYNVIADVRAAMEGLLEPIFKEVVQGRAEVRQLFRVPKVGTVAGCYVTEGKITRNAPIKLVRDGVVVWDGKVGSLKRIKDDAREVMSGYECGIGIENYNDLREGDIIESYVKEKIERKL